MKLELLDPFPLHFRPVAFSWLEPVRDIVCDDFAPKTIAAYVESFSRANSRVIGVVADGRLAGIVAFDAVNPVTALMHVLFAPFFRGAKNKGMASRMACERVWKAGVRKILALIPEDNRPAIALALRNGGRVEGVLKNHTLRNGKPVNAVAIGITKEEFDLGTEFRRIDGRQQQQDAITEQLDQHTDIHTAAERPATASIAGVDEHVAGDGHGRHESASAGDRDAERGPDQQDGRGGTEEPAAHVRKPRVRSKRAVGPGHASDGARQGSRTRQQSGKRRKPPVAAE